MIIFVFGVGICSKNVIVRMLDEIFSVIRW